MPKSISSTAGEESRRREALVGAGMLQSAIFTSVNLSAIVTDTEGVIQTFSVGAERMLGYTAAEVVNKLTPADLAVPQELVARAHALSVEFGVAIAPGLEALLFKASRGIPTCSSPPGSARTELDFWP